MIKTYKGWGKFESLEDYLKIGDRVDNEMYEHFLNVLPPLTHRGDMLQVSEPYDHIGGKGTYTTFSNDGEGWIYKGHCFKGENVNR